MKPWESSAGGTEMSISSMKKVALTSKYAHSLFKEILFSASTLNEFLSMCLAASVILPQPHRILRLQVCMTTLATLSHVLFEGGIV